MRRQIALAFGSAVLGLLAVGLLVINATTRPAAVPAAAASGQVYSSIRDLMDSIVDPSADVLWGAAGTVVDKEGIHDLFPKNDEEWLNVRRAAIRIIEGGNLLMMPGRDAAPPGAKSATPGVELEPTEIADLMKKNRKDFDGFAKALQVIGTEALRAIDAKNTEMLVDVGARMDAVCESCHQTFWYPDEKVP